MGARCLQPNHTQAGRGTDVSPLTIPLIAIALPLWWIAFNIEMNIAGFANLLEGIIRALRERNNHD